MTITYWLKAILLFIIFRMKYNKKKDGWNLGFRRWFALSLTPFAVIVSLVSKENFDVEIGEKIAYENARNKIWELEGYLLQEKVYINGVK
jgi:hypothetical protein